MNNKTNTLAAALLSLSATALAGPADDAQAHFKAIAAGNVEHLMQGYAGNATLHWVGGPLDGAYAGSGEIRQAWEKFAKANAPLEVSMARLEESANPKGSTVTANVEFKGKAAIKVRYVLLYRDGKLASEIWQIDPKLTLGY